MAIATIIRTQPPVLARFPDRSDLCLFFNDEGWWS